MTGRILLCLVVLATAPDLRAQPPAPQPTAPTGPLAARLQRIDALAGKVHALAAEVPKAARESKGLERLAQQLDHLLKSARFDGGLRVDEREEVTVRVAWKLEPAVFAATQAVQRAVGQPQTDDDTWASRAREAATQLYDLRDAWLRAGATTGQAGVFARIRPILDAARPPATATAEARQDFAEVAEHAAWDLRRALFPTGDPHASGAFRAITAMARKAGEDLDGGLQATTDPGAAATQWHAAWRAIRAKLQASARELTAEERAELALWTRARQADGARRLTERSAPASPLPSPATPTVKP